MTSTQVADGSVEQVVVVVDDDPKLLDLFVRALEGAEIEVRGVPDFPSLMDTLDQVTPAVILMDVNMPELFGDEVAGILKEGRKTPSKIFLHSSMDERELARMVDEAGLDGFIPKMLGTKNMIARVREAMTKSPG